jgi:predicted amidophosphoribosyltransferase
MEIICPSCGKANEATPCRRCGCELSQLFAVCRAAEVELRIAAKCLSSGNVAEAREHATHSWELHHSSEAARLAFLACIALQDFARSRHWHRRATTL